MGLHNIVFYLGIDFCQINRIGDCGCHSRSYTHTHIDTHTHANCDQTMVYLQSEFETFPVIKLSCVCYKDKKTVSLFIDNTSGLIRKLAEIKI